MLNSLESCQSIQTPFVTPFGSHAAERRPVPQQSAGLHALIYACTRSGGLNLPRTCPGAHLHRDAGDAPSPDAATCKSDPASVILMP